MSKQQLGKINSEKFLKRNVLYMYVNNRPVDFLQSLYKGLEDLFKQWNSFGRFLCIIKLRTQTVDISSTPDKRYLFSKEEPRIVEAVLRKINTLMEGWYHRPKEVSINLLTRPSVNSQQDKKSEILDKKSRMSVSSNEQKEPEKKKSRLSEAVKSRFSGML